MRFPIRDERRELGSREQLAASLTRLKNATKAFFNSLLTLKNATTTVVVNGGELNLGLVPYGGFFRYHDHAHRNEETTWSVNPLVISPKNQVLDLAVARSGGFGAPRMMDDGSLLCRTHIGSLEAECRFELVGSNAKQTFTFRASRLDGSTFVYYAENDLFSHKNDVASYTGSIDEGDLALYMYDSAAGGLSVKLTGEAVKNSSLTLFGAGLWTRWGENLERGNLRVLSRDGRNFVRYGDLGLALAFELRGEEAVVVINYDTQPAPPYDPDSLRYLEPSARVTAPASASEAAPADGSVSTTPITPREEQPEDLRRSRQWELESGQVVTGVLVGVVPRFQSVQIRLLSGRILTLRVEKLSPEDRLRVAPLFE